MTRLGASRVFVDANVLYSQTLRDWLALLMLESSTPPYRVYWTEDVMAEVIYHLRKDHPTWDGGKISRIRDRITGTFEGGRVEDFVITQGFDGSDPHDAHVHAAALACGADYLLTGDDPDDFTQDPDSLPYELMTPDGFFMLIEDSQPGLVRDVTRKQMSYWAKKCDEALLPQFLDKAGCPRFAGAVAHHQAEIGGLV
ncbi:PIN domain-containing protein [Actinomycetota bacterium]